MVAATIFFFVFFVFLFFIQEARAQNYNCSTDFCSRSFSPVRFPFHIQGDGQPPSCGFPGFDLSCSGAGDTVLRLPNSGDFIVRSIDYFNQKIVLYDPTYCLVERLLKLNVTGSPFHPYLDIYNFFDCPSNKTLLELGISSSDIVHCLSNATNTVVATTNTTYNYANHCQFKGSHLLAVSSRTRTRQNTASDLEIDFTLWWFAPDCGDCEFKGGVCAFTNYTAQQIGCFYKSKPQPGRRRRGPNIFKLICFTIGVPVFICIMAVGCYLRFANRGSSTQIPNTETSRHSNVAILPQPPVLSTGLDDLTIQSFEKVVVGESRRMSGPNHIVCSICLSEYLPKDILRRIPECNHCFHAECIDKWLSMNRSCPICRNSSAHD